MMKKNSGFREGIDTLIGSTAVFTGNIESDGTVRVDGKVIGDIRVTGDVYIGNNAKVQGNIDACNIYLAGTVEGNIIANGLLKVLSTARLYGDIKVNSFVTDEGALFQGKCEMLVNPPADKTDDRSGKNRKKGNASEDSSDRSK